MALKLFKKSSHDKYDAQIVSFIKKNFGFTPKELEYYKRALTHKSFSYRKKGTENFERLEFLGDAILDSVIAHYLFKKYPKSQEGFLSKLKSRIVNRQMLNDVGNQIGLYDLIRKNISNPKGSQSIVGNSLEALIGAIYLEKGFLKTQQIIEIFFIKKWIKLDTLISHDTDYKSQILIWSQQNKQSLDFSHKKIKNDLFEIKLSINDKVVATTTAKSKKEAEQEASKIALEQLGV